MKRMVILVALIGMALPMASLDARPEKPGFEAPTKQDVIVKVVKNRHDGPSRPGASDEARASTTACVARSFHQAKGAIESCESAFSAGCYLSSMSQLMTSMQSCSTPTPTD